MRWVLCFILVFLLSCTVRTKDENNASDISLSTSSPTKPKTELTDCLSDFEFEIGKGLLAIKLNENKLRIFEDSLLQNFIGFIDFQKPAPRFISQQQVDTVKWFINPTEYNYGMLISPYWNDSTAKIKLALNDSSIYGWIDIFPSQFEKQPTFWVIQWKTILTNHTLWIEDSLVHSNGVYSASDILSERIVFEPYYPIYSADSVVDNWIRLQNLKTKHGIYGSDTFTESIGWYRWWSEGKMQLSLPDFYTLEAFYTQEH